MSHMGHAARDNVVDTVLHTEECNKLIAELLQCRAENNPFTQIFLNPCSAIFQARNNCTRKERLARREESARRAKEEGKRVRKEMKRNEGKTLEEIMAERIEQAKAEGKFGKSFEEK